MNHNDIPQSALRALYYTQEAAGAAVIAGGFLRDIDNGVPYNDVDIFYSTTLDTMADTLRKITVRLGCEIEEGWTPDLSQYREWDATLVGHHHVDFLGLDVNLVGLDHQPLTSRSVCARMDFGMCQIAHNGRALYKSDLYELDRFYKQFCIASRPAGEDDGSFNLGRSIQRWHRWADKYPDWPLVVERTPEVLRDLDNNSIVEDLLR